MEQDPGVPFEPASTYLDAALVSRRGSPLVKAFRTAVGIAAGLLTNDMESGPSAIDLVVTRRETGAEVLRVTAGTAQEADLLLRRVRRDLATKDVTAFISEWRVLPQSPASAED